MHKHDINTTLEKLKYILSYIINVVLTPQKYPPPLNFLATVVVVHKARKLLLTVFLSSLLILTSNPIRTHAVINLQYDSTKELESLIQNGSFEVNTEPWVKSAGTSFGVAVIEKLDGKYSGSGRPELKDGTYIFEAYQTISAEYLDLIKSTESRGLAFSYFFKLWYHYDVVHASAIIEYEAPSSIGCPYVLVWTGSEYVLENNILPKSELYNGRKEVNDYYLIDRVDLPKTKLKIKIAEFENEISRVNVVKAYQILYPNHYSIVLVDNKPVLWDPLNVISLDKAIYMNQGVLVTDKVLWSDHVAFEGSKGDKLIITFNNVNLSNPLLLIRANYKISYSIKVYALFNNTTWEYIGEVHTRRFYKTYALRVPRNFITNNTVTFQLELTDKHRIDYIALAEEIHEELRIKEMKLVKAFKKSRNIKRLIEKNDTLFVIIAPGDEIYLTFLGEKKPRKGYKVAYLLYFEGLYRSLTEREIKLYNNKINAIDPPYEESTTKDVDYEDYWNQIAVYAQIPTDAQWVRVKIKFTSSEDFLVHFDLAEAYIAEQKTASCEAGSIKLVSLIEYRSPKLIKKRKEWYWVDINTALYFQATSNYATKYSQIKIVKSDTTPQDELISIINSTMMGFDSSHGENYHPVEVIKDTIYTLKGISSALSMISILLGIVSLVPKLTFIGVASVAAGSISTTMSMYNLSIVGYYDLQASGGDNIAFVKVPYPSAIGYTGNLALYGGLAFKIRWDDCTSEGINKIRIHGKAYFGTIYYNQYTGVKSIGSPYYTASTYIDIYIS